MTLLKKVTRHITSFQDRGRNLVGVVADSGILLRPERTRAINSVGLSWADAWRAAGAAGEGGRQTGPTDDWKTVTRRVDTYQVDGVDVVVDIAPVGLFLRTLGSREAGSRLLTWGAAWSVGCKNEVARGRRGY